MKTIVTFLLNAVAVAITAYLLPGVTVGNFLTACIVAIVLAIVNAFIRPVLLFFTLPLNIVTLGLFTFILNALLILLVAVVVPGFMVSGFWWALLFSLILSLVHVVLFSVF